MRYSFHFCIILTLLFADTLLAQAEGWWHACNNSFPNVTEILIDGCGDEAKSEHVFLQVGKLPFNLNDYRLKVSNPQLNNLIGEVSIEPNSTNVTAINYLNSLNTACAYGNIFIDAQASPYNGVVPPQSALLIFNDKNNTDVYYLDKNFVKNWCGSKIFVAFGTVKNTIGGQSIFKNYSPDTQCAPFSCLREINLQLEPGGNFCDKVIYDITKLPHSVKYPPVGEGNGSYITPNANNTVNYLGGNLYGINSCVPEKLWNNQTCIISPLNISVTTKPLNQNNAWLTTCDISKLIPPINIKWNGANIVSQSDSTNVIATKGFLTIEVKDGRSCPITQNFEVGSLLAFGVKISGQDTVCSGSNNNLTANINGGTAPIKVEWYDAKNNLLEPNSKSYFAATTNSTFFVAKAIDASGLIATDTFKVFARPLPNVRINSNAQRSICNDAVVEFYATGAQSYAWTSIPSIASDGLNKKTGDTVKLFALFLPAPGYIIIATGTDIYGCENSVFDSIKVIPLPRVTINPVTDTVCVSDSPIKLTGTADAGKDNGNLSLALAEEKYVGSCANCVQGDVFYPKLATIGLNIIHHEVTNNYGCMNSPSINITVKVCNCTTPPVLKAGGNMDVCKIQPISLNGIAQNVTSSVWSTAGTGTFGDVNQLNTSYFPSYSDSTSGSIKLYLKSSKVQSGCSNITDSLSIRFLGASKSAINRVICATDSFRVSKRFYKTTGTYTDTLTNFLGCDSIVTLQLSVLKNDNTILNQTSCDASKVGTKSVTLKNANGCDSVVTTITTFSKSDSTFITLNTCDASLTGKSTTQFTNRLGCDSVVITQNIFRASDTLVRNLPTCKKNEVGSDTLRLKNKFGCDSLIITKKTLVRLDTIQNLVFSCNPRDTGITTSIFQSASGCDGVQITTTKLRRVDTAVINRTICTGDSVKVGNTTYKSSGVFSQTFSGYLGCDSVVSLILTVLKPDTTQVISFTCRTSEIGTFFITKKNNKGCDSIIQNIVQLKQSAIRFGLTVVKPISCNGTTDGAIAWFAPKGGTPPYVVKWHTNATTDTLKNVGAGTYYLTLTDAQTCTKTDSITIDQPNKITVQFLPNAPPCFPDSLGSLKITSINNGAGKLKINYQNTSFDSVKLPLTITNVSVGTHSLNIVDANQCNVDTAFTIRDAPVRQFDLGSDVKIALGDSVIIGSSINFNPNSVKWTPSTGLSCDSCLNPVAHPLISTRYDVFLKDSSGCTFTNKITVFVDKRKAVYLPNVFSPNGDNINDTYLPFTDNSIEKINEFSIYNRWGEQVFTLHNFKIETDTNGWHGDMNGTAAPIGVYLFVLQVVYKDGKSEVLQGDFTLVR